MSHFVPSELLAVVWNRVAKQSAGNLICSSFSPDSNHLVVSQETQNAYSRYPTTSKISAPVEHAIDLILRDKSRHHIDSVKGNHFKLISPLASWDTSLTMTTLPTLHTFRYIGLFLPCHLRFTFFRRFCNCKNASCRRGRSQPLLPFPSSFPPSRRIATCGPSVRFHESIRVDMLLLDG